MDSCSDAWLGFSSDLSEPSEPAPTVVLSVHHSLMTGRLMVRGFIRMGTQTS